MKQKVMLSICGRQSYPGQKPENIELVTEGEMEFREGGWDISYQESELTGLGGVTTTFRIEPNMVILNRTGKLRSQMIFRQGETYESLYEMDFGALMMSVTARQVIFDLTPEGGFVDLAYEVEIEHGEAGLIDYHLDIRTLQE